jgi:preprotein translocase subunit YajC
MFDFLMGTAFAQAAAAAKQPSVLETFIVPMGGLLLIMYFLVIRPQQKKTKELAQMLGALKAGDEVVTSGGILGRVKSIADTFVTIDMGGAGSVKVLKTHITALTKPKDQPAAVK